MNHAIQNPSREYHRWLTAAHLVALCVLLLIPVASLIRPMSVDDFAQYYMGGLMARLDPSQMYPLPHPNATLNAGYAVASDLLPRYADEAQARGIADENRYILPPPTALLFVPLSYLPYRAAFAIWQLLMALCCWRLAVMAGHIHIMLTGRITRTAALLVLAVAISPLMWRTLRTGQISPLVGYAIAAAVLAMWRAQPLRSATGILLATLTKYAGIMLVPLLLIQRRWKSLLMLIVLTAAFIITSRVWMGDAPFGDFVDRISPTLKRPSPYAYNQSVQGFLLRITHSDTLSATMQLGVRIAAGTCLAVVLVLLILRKRAIRNNLPAFLAAAALLLLNLLLFSPIMWEHYYIYFCPWWGYLLWEARQSKLIGLLSLASIASIWMPWCVVRAGHLPIPEPLMSHMLIAGFVIAAIAARRVWIGEVR